MYRTEIPTWLAGLIVAMSLILTVLVLSGVYNGFADIAEYHSVIESPDSVTLVYGVNTEHCTEIKNISKYEADISGTNGNPIYNFDVEYIDDDLNTQKTVIISPERIDVNGGDLIIYV